MADEDEYTAGETAGAAIMWAGHGADPSALPLSLASLDPDTRLAVQAGAIDVAAAAHDAVLRAYGSSDQDARTHRLDDQNPPT